MKEKKKMNKHDDEYEGMGIRFLVTRTIVTVITYNPCKTIKLDKETYNKRLGKVAKKLSISRHRAMQIAIEQFLEREEQNAG